MKKFTQTALASLLTLVAAGANAAAFQLAEVSSSGLGLAYAGNAAVANNASVIATNPALMTQFERPEISVGGVLVDTNIKIYGRSANGNNAYAEKIVPTSLLPNLYFVAPFNEKFALGAGYNVNYGLKTEYDSNYSAGSLAGKTELAAHNFNLSGAYDLGAGFSFGAGVNAIYSDAEITRHLGDNYDKIRAGATQAQQAAALYTQTAAQYAQLGLTQQAQVASATATKYSQTAAQYNALAQRYSRSTVVSNIKGDKWSFGWNAGLSYQLNKNHRFGIAYHSAVNVKFKGQYSNDLIANLGTIYATYGRDTDGKLTLALPAYWEISGFHQLTDKFAVQYSYKRTEWDRFKSLDAYSLDNSKQYLHKNESFRNADRYALGVSYDAMENLTLRAGVAYDRTASLSHQSISIPDTNRMWYSAGLTYRFNPNLAVDAGYAYLRGTKTSFTEDGAAFNTRARANLYGLNLNYKF